MKEKRKKTMESEATGKLPWSKLTLQKLLNVDQTSSGAGTGDDAGTTNTS